MRTANLAIVFTDIKGFTERTSRQTLEQNEKLLATHNALLAPLFKAYGGRVIKMIGDAFLVTFESPTHAVLSGAAIQDRLWAHNRGVPTEEQLHVRIAINVGEVRLDDGDVYGEPVNIAARVEGEAEADEVTFTEAVYLSMNRAEVASEPWKTVELKGIPEPVKLFRVTRATSDPSQQPFGGKALERAETSPVRSTSGELSQKAVALAATAAEAASRAVSSGAKKVQDSMQRQGVSRRTLAASIAGAVGLVALAWLVFGPNAIERAIAAAASAPKGSRQAEVANARKLIAEEQDAGRRNFYTGRLSEALGEASNAAGYYAHAVKGGSKEAEDRLISLLRHDDCAFRSAAASSIADVKLTRARGALEELADDGGKGDGEKVLGLFGCNSKDAAAEALKRLGQ
ncbi:MAG: adenylate/guanylate cyclase domain-containing protein [Myxococcota bacterium]